MWHSAGTGQHWKRTRAHQSVSARQVLVAGSLLRSTSRMCAVHSTRARIHGCMARRDMPGKSRHRKARWFAAHSRTGGFVKHAVLVCTQPVTPRRGNRNHNHDLKNLFKSAATTASGSDSVFDAFYENLLQKGMRAEMARLTWRARLRPSRYMCGRKERRSTPSM